MDDEATKQRYLYFPLRDVGRAAYTSRSKREALWAEFQASLSAPSPSGHGAEPKKTVKIEKRFRFAGEDVV